MIKSNPTPAGWETPKLENNNHIAEVLPEENSQKLFKFKSIKQVMLFNHFILCCSFLLPSILPSIWVFFKESVLCIQWSKYQSFSFSISPSNEYSGLISFRMDWLDLLAVQGMLKNLLQHHSLKVSILWRSAFLMIQLTTGKSTALTIQIFVSKAMSLLFNMHLGLSQLFFQGASVF